MQSIKITAMVDAKRRIMIDLPEEVPVGRVEITVRPGPIGEKEEPTIESPSLTREEARAKLIAAGLLDPNAHYAPDDAEELSEEEEEELARRVAGGRPAEDYVNEDREERF